MNIHITLEGPGSFNACEDAHKHKSTVDPATKLGQGPQLQDNGAHKNNTGAR